MLDSLLKDLGAVCGELLPIIGAVALIYLCTLLKHAWKAIDTLNDRIKDLGPTIQLANQSIEKVQAPLDTAVRLSHTVDEVHDKTVSSVNKLADSASEGIDRIRSKVTGREDDVTEQPQPSSEEGK